MDSQRGQSSTSSTFSKRKAPPNDSADILTSIACRRCRSKKIKCDAELPKCHACSKSASECLIFDSTTGETHERSHLAAIQEKVSRLEELLAGHPTVPEQLASNITRRSSSEDERLPRYVGDESGNRFMENAIIDMDRASPDQNASRHSQGRLEEARVAYVPPHGLPTCAESLGLIMAYMQRFHPLHPILSQKDIWKLHERLYPDSGPPRKSELSDDESFKLFMVYALGSVSGHCTGEQEKHPFGYFAAALECLLVSGFAFSTLSELQNFLLIARFGTFHYIGCSIWELGQTCVRISIELGIHRYHPGPNHDHEEQMRRRVFWDCYHLDRMSSSTLGRPFGIGDTDISAPLPTNAPDDSSQNMPLAGDPLSSLTTLSVFNHTIELMKIESSIRSDLLPQSPKQLHPSYTDFDHLYETFFVHSKSLHDWWTHRPLSGAAQGVYQEPEYFDFLYRRKKLDLTRALLGQVWKSKFRSRELLRGCLRVALSVLSLFSTLCSKKIITYTRGFIHLIFSTGLSVISTCIELMREQSDVGSGNWPADIEAWWADLFQEIPTHLSTQDILNGLSLALDLLQSMSSHVPDTLQYTQAFASLKRKFEIHLRRIGQDRATNMLSTQCERSPANLFTETPINDHQGALMTTTSGEPALTHDFGQSGRLENIEGPVTGTTGLPLHFDNSSMLEMYDEAAQLSWDSFDVMGNCAIDPWAYAPPMMEQMSFDLLDYTWEAPILWQNYEGG